jgi:hypothetical protein
MIIKTLGFLAITMAAGALVACGSDAEPSDGGGGSGGQAAGGSGGGGTNPACADATDPTMCSTCLDRAEELGQTVNALVTCTCSNCATQLQTCVEGADQAENDKCYAVVQCGQTNGCRGTECYCGVGVTVADCLANGPTGPCANEIAVAAGCDGETDLVQQAVCVNEARADANSTLGKASAVGSCSTGDPGLMPPVEGNCAGL